MLRRFLHPRRGRGAVDEPTVNSEDEDARAPDLVARRLSQLSGGAALAPPAANSPGSAFLVNVAAAAATPDKTTMLSQQGSASFSSTPTFMRLRSSRAVTGCSAGSAVAAAAAAGAARAPAAAAAPGPAPAPASDPLPAERRLVWTQSKSRREAWLLQEAKLGGVPQDDEGGGGGGGGGMSGVREDETTGSGSGGGGSEDEPAATAAAAEPRQACGDLDDGNEDEDDETGFGDDGGPYGSREDRRRLRLRLARLGLALQRCEGDGACLFRAVSAQLYGGSQAHHGAVRAAAVAHMAARRADYEAFLGEDVGAYLAGMACPWAWGDELTLRAVSDALRVVVHVVTSDALGWYTVYVPAEGGAAADGQGQEQEQEQQERPQQAPPREERASQGEGRERRQAPPDIFVSYLAPVHYDSLVPSARQQQQPPLREEGGRATTGTGEGDP